MSSLSSAVTILRCFSAETPELAVTEIAAKTSMPKSTVSRLLQAMVEQGLVEQDKATRRHRVGLLPFRLGQLYYGHVKVMDLVEAEMDALVEETGFTGYVGVLNEAEIIILRKKHGRFPVQMVLAPGTRVAAATTAFGKALLARLSDDELQERLSTVPDGRDNGERRPMERLLREIDTVRDQHWAIGDSAFPGMCAIGAAVGGAHDQQAIGFSLSFPDIAVNPETRRAIADRVVAVARKVGESTADPFWTSRSAPPSSAAKGNGTRVQAVKPQRRQS